MDDYFGTRVADPYRWLEDADSEATQKWSEAQNQVTQDYLNTPERRQIKTRLEQIWNYPRYGTPSKKGNDYFFWKNDGLQKKYVLYRSSTLNGPAKLILDPNTLHRLHSLDCNL